MTPASNQPSLEEIGQKLAEIKLSIRSYYDTSTAIARSRGPQNTSGIETYVGSVPKSTIKESKNLRKPGSGLPSKLPAGPPPTSSNLPPSDPYHGTNTAAKAIAAPTATAPTNIDANIKKSLHTTAAIWKKS
jgi:hypothetical protein